MMSSRARITVRILAVTLFAVVAPASVLYALGYRYNAHNQEVGRIAFLLAETEPRSASVYLDDDLIGSQTPARAHAVEPGTHSVRIEREDTFTWIKRLSFVGGLATRAQDITLFLKEPVKHTLFEKPITWSSQHTQHPLAIAHTETNELMLVTTSSVEPLGQFLEHQTQSIEQSIQWHPTKPIATALLDSTTGIVLEEGQPVQTISLPETSIAILPSPTINTSVLSLSETGSLYMQSVIEPPDSLEPVAENVSRIVLTESRALLYVSKDGQQAWHQLTHRDLPISRTSISTNSSLAIHRSLTAFISSNEAIVARGWQHRSIPKDDLSESITLYDGQYLYFDSISSGQQTVEAQHLATYPPDRSSHTFGFVSGAVTRAIAYNDLPTTFTYDKTNLPHTDAVPTSLSIGQLQDIHRLSREARATQWHPFATSMYTLYNNKLVITEIDSRDGRETYSHDLDSFIPENVGLFLCDDEGQCVIPTETGLDRWTLY